MLANNESRLQTFNRVLWNDSGPHFVDFDDCRMGPAVQDLCMLISGERDAMQGQLAIIIKGYEDFCEFDDNELQLIAALRTLHLVHYSGWIAGRIPVVQHATLLAGPRVGVA